MTSGFAGFRFPCEVVLLAVRCFLRYGLTSWDLEELLAGTLGDGLLAIGSVGELVELLGCCPDAGCQRHDSMS